MLSIGNIHMKLHEITETGMPKEWWDWLQETNQKWLIQSTKDQEEWMRDHAVGDTFNLDSFAGLSIDVPSGATSNWADNTKYQFVPPPFKLGNVSPLKITQRNFSGVGLSWLPETCGRIQFDKCELPADFSVNNFKNVHSLEHIDLRDCTFNSGITEFFDQSWTTTFDNSRGPVANHIMIVGHNGVGKVSIAREQQPFSFNDIFELQEYLMDHRFPDLA